MATRDSFPVIIADGDQLNDGYFNGIATVFGKCLIHNRLVSEIAHRLPIFDQGDGSTAVFSSRKLNAAYAETPGFTYEIFQEKSSTSHIDTTNSTCLYTESGLVAFCDVLDLHDDGSIAASIWNTSTAAGGSVAESSGYLQLETSLGGSSTTAAAISNGASGLDIHGQNAEVILDVELYANKGGSTPTANAQIQISNGTTHVTLVDQTTGSSTSSQSRAIYRIVYDHTNTRCDVYVRYLTESMSSNAESSVQVGEEILLTDNTSVAAVTTNKYIRFFATSNNSLCQARVRCYGIGYRKNGASAGNSDLVFNKTLPSTGSTGMQEALWYTKPAADPSAVYSLDGTTTYNATSSWGTFVAAPSSGTSLKTRVRVAKPTTITADTKNIPMLLAWGMLYG
jgi:hypothetical protein